MSEAWKKYAADFEAMTNKEIENECEVCRNQVEEAEEWLDEHALKWEEALCVKVNLGPGEFAWYIGATCAS